MSAANQSIGKDIRVVITTATGNLNIPTAAITKFDAQPVTADEKRTGLDGEARHVIFHNGWKGGFEIDRFDSTLDDYWATAEANYYNGVNTAYGFIQETIQEPNGGISQYRYEKVVYKVTDIGAREGDKVVKMKLEFMASRRLKVQ
jgi:hypothetical protein